MDLQRVLPEPGRSPGPSDGSVELPSLAQAAAALAAGGQTTQLTVLLHRGAHPVDLWIPADSLVEGVDHDDLVVLIGGVLTHPVRVQNSQPLQLPARE